MSSQPGVDLTRDAVLYDPQTSGGLLVAASADAADLVENTLSGAGVLAARIGILTTRRPGTLVVVLP